MLLSSLYEFVINWPEWRDQTITSIFSLLKKSVPFLQNWFILQSPYQQWLTKVIIYNHKAYYMRMLFIVKHLPPPNCHISISYWAVCQRVLFIILHSVRPVMLDNLFGFYVCLFLCLRLTLSNCSSHNTVFCRRLRLHKCFVKFTHYSILKGWNSIFV